MFKLHPNTVLVELLEDDRRSLFEKKIKTNDGKQISLVTDLKAEENSDDALYQTVNLGRVISVAEDVTHILVGDIVLLDYTVDISPEHTVMHEDEYKLVCLQAKNTYHDDEAVLYPNRQRQRMLWVWRKGERREITPILGMYRNGTVIPNDDIVFCEYNNDNVLTLMFSGIHYNAQRNKIVSRVVVAAPEASQAKPGDGVMIENSLMFPFKFGDIMYDMVFQEDILCRVHV